MSKKYHLSVRGRFSKALSILVLPALLALGAARNSQASGQLASWYATVASEGTYPQSSALLPTGIKTTTRSYLGLVPEAGSRFTWSGLPTGAAVDTGSYLEYTITVSDGYTATLEELMFGMGSTKPVTLTARSSADNYTADLATTTSGSTSTGWYIPLPATVASGQSLTVRVYLSNAASGAKFSNSIGADNSLSALFLGTVEKASTPPGGSSASPETASTKKKGTTKSSTFKFKGSQNGNVDVILWKVGKAKKFKSKNIGRALTYSFKIKGLKKGKNTVYYYGLDLKTGQKTSVKKLVITGK